MMPLHLLFVRHGESEGNAAMAAAKRGDLSRFTDEYVTTPGRLWKLTDVGVAQAQCTGAWLEQEAASGAFGIMNRQYFVSPLVRTRQTAGHLGLTDVDKGEVHWRLNRSIRERDWGDIETMPRAVFREKYPDSSHREQHDPLYWRPPGGEAIADVADLRVRNFMDTLHRENTNDAVFAVSHGEFMRAAYLVLTRANDEKYSEWEDTKEMSFKNCEVLHFTRRTPKALMTKGMAAGRLSRKLAYVRRARPVLVDGVWTQQVTDWEEINFATYTNAELLAHVK